MRCRYCGRDGFGAHGLASHLGRCAKALVAPVSARDAWQALLDATQARYHNPSPTTRRAERDARKVFAETLARYR